MVRQLAGTWAFEDPAAYKKFLETADPEGLPRHLVIGGLDNLLRKDAAGTLDWTLRTQKPATNGSALQTWSRTDAPVAALDWATTLPAGPTSDAAVASLRKNLESNTTLKPETRDTSIASLAKP